MSFKQWKHLSNLCTSKTWKTPFFEVSTLFPSSKKSFSHYFILSKADLSYRSRPEWAALSAIREQSCIFMSFLHHFIAFWFCNCTKDEFKRRKKEQRCFLVLHLQGPRELFTSWMCRAPSLIFQGCGEQGILAGMCPSTWQGLSL